ncbi:CDP-diacylglycerol--serine O-phosphatidyltransferase [Saccharomonospora sp. NB11]|jgi:CDP-diacylglycerol--serine O-phosphatidyltransferase|uniref:CDP-diacylglycerol--serine O-phosphatidyltransferase n=1 Tax=Saccharomonospora sp. NB11 TaxID=1642298 RepID=UPI0018D178B1|nr:CDP-diacylglycerol--serine O-phosphatidyltransferase [Saccharomonospora sp. NB11]
MSRTTPGVRLLPNAITVLALCAGLSAVQFALNGQFGLAIGAIGIAAVLDSLDGRIARLLDATSKMGAELDSLSDAISFGVAPALVLYVWLPEPGKFGWVAALIFAVCMVLRLARFNTLLDDEEQPPYAAEFFVGVPAPAGGLLALLPMMATLEFGEGWWSDEVTVWIWTVGISALCISRIPTLSLKKLKVPARVVAPLLVVVGLAAAATIQYPVVVLMSVLLLYLVHLPYAVRRYQWLAKHPEAWDVPPKERRAIRRNRSQRRLGLRKPQFHKVAGAARRAVRRPRASTAHVPRVYPPETVSAPRSRDDERGPRRRNWRRIGLRQGRD